MLLLCLRTKLLQTRETNLCLFFVVKNKRCHSLFSILNDIFCSFVNLEDGTTQITTNHQLSLLLFSLIWKEIIDIVPASHSMKSAVQPNPNIEQ